MEQILTFPKTIHYPIDYYNKKHMHSCASSNNYTQSNQQLIWMAIDKYMLPYMHSYNNRNNYPYQNQDTDKYSNNPYFLHHYNEF